MIKEKKFQIFFASALWSFRLVDIDPTAIVDDVFIDAMSHFFLLWTQQLTIMNSALIETWVLSSFAA